jgi:hypothetical protein
MSAQVRRWLWPLVSLALVLAAGCGDADGSDMGTDDESAGATGSSTAENGYVGRLDGTDAFVAVVIGGDRVAVYACDDESGIAEGFWGQHDGSASVELSGESGSTASVAVAGDGVTGTITLADGTSHAFEAEPAIGDAGLYILGTEDPGDAELAAAWVVDNDGEPRGAARRGRRRVAAPQLTNSGARVEGKTFLVARFGIVAPNNIVAPNSIVAPSNLTADSGIEFKAPSPAGPIPIPFPNTGVVTERK